VHEDPTLHKKNYYIARIDLAPFGFDDLIEQVWLSRLSAAEFLMCCIPFRAYGLALGDVVRLSQDGSLITEIVRPSGNRVMRALLVDGLSSRERSAIAESLNDVTRNADLMQEWSGDRYIAIDIPPSKKTDTLIDLLKSEQHNGRLFWEWGDVIPFST